MFSFVIYYIGYKDKYSGSVYESRAKKKGEKRALKKTALIKKRATSKKEKLGRARADGFFWEKWQEYNVKSAK